MALFIGAKVVDLDPGVTVVDVGALVITGILTRLFFGFRLTPRRPKSIESNQA